MKQKLLLALLALFTLGGSNLFAQTDVTSTYLTNADFSSTDGWTQEHSSQYWSLGNGLIGTYAVANDKKSTTDDTHLATEYCLGMQCRWQTNYANFSQTTEPLPEGVYTLTFDVENTNTSTKATYENRFFVKVGETTYADDKNEWMNGTSNWTTHSISFTLSEESAATISLGYGTGSNNLGSGSTPHLYVSHLKLTWADPLAAAKDALQAEIDRAKLCDAKEGLADAIAAAEEALANATTAEELSAALAALQTADKDALLRYDNGLADASAQNGMATTFVVNGTFNSNTDGWTATGGFQNNTLASNQQGDFTVPFWENWNGSAKVNKMYQTINNIPNGTYKLKIAAFVDKIDDPNDSQFVFANTDNTYLTTTAPTFYEVWTVVTDNKVEVGLEQTEAIAQWMGIDNVSLTYYGAGDVIEEAQVGAHKTNWEEALAAAQAAVANNDYANITGKERADLEAEIAKAEPSTAEGYDEATIALRNATTSFTAAKTNYDIFAAYNKELSYADASKKPVIDNTTTATTLISALRAYYESHALAEGVEGAIDKTNIISNPNATDGNNGWTWTGSKNDPKSNESWTDANGTNNHSYFDGGNWGANSWTTTMKQTVSIPAGKYLLTAKGRSAENTTLTMAVGEASVQLPHVGATGNVFDRGWGDASVEFETDGAGADILVTASSNTLHEWFSISNFRLVQLEAITVPMADADDYAALATAITEAEAKTLGFDEGEYAPYNNVAALQALAAAKAIDPEAEDGNTKEVVQNATTALTTATWTANTEEVDAIFDGQFAKTEALSETGKVVLPGWTKVDGIRLLVKDETVDPGLAYTDGKAAVFSWGGTTLTYGEQAGYTLPMNKYSIYELTFKVSGWRDGDMPSYISVELDGIKQEINNPEVKAINSTDGNPFATLKFYVTPSNDNSTLKIYANHHFTIADLSMKLANAIRLTDEAEVVPETTTNEVTVLYDRKLLSGWNSLVLPFDVTQEELGIDNTKDGERVLAYGGTTKNGENDYTINFNDVEGNLTANTPYLIKKADDGENMSFTGKVINAANTLEVAYANNAYTFVGTYVAKAAEDNFIKAGDLTVGASALKKVKAAKAIKAFRAFLRTELTEEEANNARISVNINGNEVDAIEAIEIINAMTDGIYNLQGQKVNAAQKGIYIVNGKKIVVR